MRADLFCRVIDNFGDIGVTWRLARQLAAELGWEIRLWVDAPDVFSRIERRLDPSRARQQIAGVTILLWPDASAGRPLPASIEPAPVVIAAFSCEPPQDFLQRMRPGASILVNLEYLSAETWIEGCHALPALRADGIDAHYFFPGFNPRTGGLLREARLEQERVVWADDRAAQYALLRDAGVSSPGLARWNSQQGAQIVTLFCYPHAPVSALIEVLTARERDTLLLVPGGTLPELDPQTRGSLRIERIEFLPQPQYDRLLWMADLNFVRGEDSVVRALWAGKPAIWHIYPQAEAAHLAKLDAWLAISGLDDATQELIRAWNAAPGASRRIEDLMKESLAPAAFARWTMQADNFRKAQMQVTDLATALDRFCRDRTARSAPDTAGKTPKSQKG